MQDGEVCFQSCSESSRERPSVVKIKAPSFGHKDVGCQWDAPACACACLRASPVHGRTGQRAED